MAQAPSGILSAESHKPTAAIGAKMNLKSKDKPICYPQSLILALSISSIILSGIDPQTAHSQAVEKNISEATKLVNEGGAAFKMGRYAEALQYYDRALKIDPHLALAWSERGVALGKLGRLDEAGQSFDRALEINPRDALTWVNKGVIARKLGRIEDELAYCDRALQINPRFGVAWFNKGAALYQLKRHAEARKAFEEAATLGIPDARRALEVLDKEEAKPPTAGTKSSPEQYQGLQPPIATAETVVTSIIKGWQQDCDQGKYAFEEPQRPKITITGQGTSVFMLKRAQDTYVASPEIPGPDGKPLTKGALMQIRTLAISGELLTSTVLSGVVWTPRATVIGKLDLTGSDKITTSSDFSFDTFKSFPAVIPFANGYAVNLFGQKLGEDGLVDTNERPKGNYVTDDGKPLVGRLIRSRFGRLEEIILVP